MFLSVKKKKKKNPQLGKKSGTTPLFQTNLYLLHTDRLEIVLVEQNMVEFQPRNLDNWRIQEVNFSFQTDGAFLQKKLPRPPSLSI